MTKPRFYLEPGKIFAKKVLVDKPQIIKQILKVLRLKKGERIFIFEGSGKEYEVEIKNLTKNQIEGEIIREEKGQREPSLIVNLYQSLLKGDKFEWVLQKGTELGVERFIPVVSENCVVRELSNNKRKRYEEIIREATEQCGGVKLARLEELITFKEAINQLDKSALNLIGWEKGERWKKIFSLKPEVNLFIGPEGGYSLREINLALSFGLKPLSLGKRILRAETAALVGLALIFNNFE
jgi:16S rRNA (uracil1498-N3)-methyltransferase